MDNQIRYTQVGEARVSTIRLPSGYEYVVAETVVFGGEHHGRCSRYESIREAVTGHELWVTRLRHGLVP